MLVVLQNEDISYIFGFQMKREEGGGGYAQYPEWYLRSQKENFLEATEYGMMAIGNILCDIDWVSSSELGRRKACNQCGEFERSLVNTVEM